MPTLTNRADDKQDSEELLQELEEDLFYLLSDETDVRSVSSIGIPCIGDWTEL